MTLLDAKALYEKIKVRRRHPKPFDEEYHCVLVLKVMMDKTKASAAAFCVEATISETHFYTWLRRHETFLECYAVGKMYARYAWEQEGERLKDEINLPGTVNLAFEHWKMKGWANYGIGKTSRIRLALDPKATPDKHYSQILEQAADGDFTAGEIKQLMEAINVGLRTHESIKMQEEIDQLKKDLITMGKNTHGNDSVSTARPAEAH